MTLIDLKVKTEYLQKIKRAKISDVLQCLRVGLSTNPETAKGTGVAILLEPYLSYERLGDTSDEGPEWAVPSEEAHALPRRVTHTTAIRRSVDVILQPPHATRASQWSTRGSTNALWNETTSFGSGRGISNM